jgi:HSP90 family molecular chaperone
MVADKITVFTKRAVSSAEGTEEKGWKWESDA